MLVPVSCVDRLAVYIVTDDSANRKRSRSIDVSEPVTDRHWNESINTAQLGYT